MGYLAELIQGPLVALLRTAGGQDSLDSLVHKLQSWYQLPPPETLFNLFDEADFWNRLVRQALGQMESHGQVMRVGSRNWALLPQEPSTPPPPECDSSKPPTRRPDLVDKLLSEPSHRHLREADLLRDFEITAILGVINERMRGDDQLKKRVVTLIERDSSLSRLVKRKRGWVCQVCGPNPATIFDTRSGPPYVEAHHIGWLSRGGPDIEANVVIVCATCHRKFHHASNSDLELSRNGRDLIGRLDGKRILIRNYQRAAT